MSRSKYRVIDGATFAAVLFLGLSLGGSRAYAQLFDESAPVGAPSSALGQSQEAQLRGLWVDAYHAGAKTPSQVDKLLADARRANINALFVQVRRRGDAYYSRSIEPRTDDPSLAPSFDALEYLIERAHNGSPRIEVHAWIAALPVWGEKERLPRDSNHVFISHGPDAPGRQNWITRRHDGESWANGYFVDPGHPDAAQYTLNVALNLVREYDVDGLHLDYIRFPDVGSRGGWGYNETSVARFNARYRRDGIPDPADPQWSQWRRDQVSALLRRVYLGTVAIKPRVNVSAAVIPWGAGPRNDAEWASTAAYSGVFQDWRAWLEEGIVDLAIPMNYFRESQAPQPEWFDRWIAWQRGHTYGRHVAAGVGLYLNNPAEGIGQVKRALGAGHDGVRVTGVALYSYAEPRGPPSGGDSEEDGAIDFWTALTTPGLANAGVPPFPSPAAVPQMPWKVEPKHGGVLVRTASLDGARIDLYGPASYGGETDGSGTFSLALAHPGTYIVTAKHPSLGEPRSAELRVTAGSVAEIELK